MADPTPDLPVDGWEYQYIDTHVYEAAFGVTYQYRIPDQRGEGWDLHLEISGRSGRGGVCPSNEDNGLIRQLATLARGLDLFDSIPDPRFGTFLTVVPGLDASGTTGGWPDGGNGGLGHAPAIGGFGGGGSSEVYYTDLSGGIWVCGGSGGGSGEPFTAYSILINHWNPDTGGFETTPCPTGSRGVNGGIDQRASLIPGASSNGPPGWGQRASFPYDFAQGSLGSFFVAQMANPGTLGTMGLGGNGGDADAMPVDGGVGGGGGGGAGVFQNGGDGGGGSKYDPDNPPSPLDPTTYPRGPQPRLAGDPSVNTPTFADHPDDLDLSDTLYASPFLDGYPRATYPEGIHIEYGYGGGLDGAGDQDHTLFGDDTFVNGQVTIKAWWKRQGGDNAFIGTIGPQP